MRNLEIEQTMYEMATTFLKQRFPKGWGGVAIDVGKVFDTEKTVINYENLKFTYLSENF